MTAKPDYFRLAVTFLAPQTLLPSPRPLAELEAEEAEAIEAYERAHPCPKHELTKLED
jgi:hypothetical protein